MKSITRKTVRAALALALLLTLLAPALANASPAYIATKSTGLNMRSGPGDSYTVLTSANRATKVQAAATQGEWTLIIVGEQAGWVKTSFLSDKQPSA